MKRQWKTETAVGQRLILWLILAVAAATSQYAACRTLPETLTLAGLTRGQWETLSQTIDREAGQRQLPPASLRAVVLSSLDQWASAGSFKPERASSLIESRARALRSLLDRLTVLEAAGKPQAGNWQTEVVSALLSEDPASSTSILDKRVEALNARGAESPGSPTLAEIYRTKGEVLELLYKFDDAADAYQTAAVDTLPSDKAGRWRLIIREADAYYDLASLSTANGRHFSDVIDILSQTALPLADREHDPRTWAITQARIGRAYAKRGANGDAVDLNAAANALEDAILAQALPASEYNEALSMLDEVVLRKIPSGSTERGERGDGVQSAGIKPLSPWPPPQWSSQTTLDRARIARGAKTLGAVSAVLSRAMADSGYEYGYYSVPHGFAIVARLERIQDDGRPADGGARFLAPDEAEPFDLARYVRHLFIAPTGLYRVIIFVVTDQPISASGEHLTVSAAETLVSKGATGLPSDLQSVGFSPDYAVTALVYEYRKNSSRAGDIEKRLPGRLTARAHLEASGISRQLGLH